MKGNSALILETSFGPVEYTITGQGFPVLFFHGGHSNCYETIFQEGWDLSKYQIITPSRPGYGKTPLGENGSTNATAQLFNELLKKLGINKVIVVGISAGGLSAIEFAAQFPDLTDKLVLISAVTEKWLNQEDELYKRGVKLFSPDKEMISWQLYRTFFRLLPKKMTSVLFKELSCVANYKITSKDIKDIRQMTFKQGSGSGFLNDLNQNFDVNSITEVKAPTLILHSENDKSVPVSMALHAKKEINNSILKIYDNNWGHLLWLGEDKVFPIEDLNSFLL